MYTRRNNVRFYICLVESRFISSILVWGKHEERVVSVKREDIFPRNFSINQRYSLGRDRDGGREIFIRQGFELTDSEELYLIVPQVSGSSVSQACKDDSRVRPL